MQGSSQELQTNVFVIVESAIFITTCFWKSKHIYRKRSPLKVVNSYKFSYLKTAVVLLTQLTWMDDPAN